LTSWRAAARVYLDRRVVTILFLGFASGLPLLLVFSTLSFWLKVEGVSLAAIGLFSLVRTPYTFKFLWAPLIDRVPLPLLDGWLGRRRGWALLSQIALMASIFAMAGTSPSEAPVWTALFALCVAFSSASQDIVIDAYRIETLKEDEQGAGAGVLVFGYRVGLLTAGAGALWLAAALTWPQVYTVMGAFGIVGIVTILMSPEPPGPAATAATVNAGASIDAGAGGLPDWLGTAVIAPFRDFATRRGWVTVLAFVMLYKLGDAYLGVMANPFYVEMGFTEIEVAKVSKVFGLGATIVGGLFGGALVMRYGILRALMLCGILQLLSNLVFAIQALAGHDVAMLIVTIGAENLSGGMATAAFVAYLSSLCSARFTATQYALLSSFMAFARDVLSSSSGWLAEQVDWFAFFVATAGLALPGLVVLAWIIHRDLGRVMVAAEGG
jgi:PAT family beta-lactamase induction signal transducer AmpG